MVTPTFKMGNEKEEKNTSEQPTQQGIVTTAAVAIKLPPLTTTTPGTWFRRAEAKFRLSGITKSTTKADHTLNAMSEDTFDHIQAWLADQPDEIDYEDLKTYIMGRFSIPASERAQKALQLAKEPLGDTRAQERWDEIQALVNKPTKVSLEKEIFLQALPSAVRQALPKAHEMATEALIKEADQLLEAHRATTRNPSVYSATDTEIQAVTTQHKKKQKENNNADESSSTKLCYFHQKFGDNAYRCRPGCPRWSKNGGQGRQ